MVQIPITLLSHAQGLEAPRYATAGSAGLDLQAAVGEPLEILPGRRALIPTGLALALPGGYEAQIRPRSGLALKHGLTVLNSPGTIDSDYRGEIQVILINLGQEPMVVVRGMRIAQMIIVRYEKAEWKPVASLDSTARNAGGFGSTGSGAPS